MRKLLIATAAISALATSAHADGNRWTGCYAKIEGGAAAANNQVAFGKYVDIDGFGATGGTVGLGGGCDVQFQQFVIGAFGDFNWLQGMDTSIDTAWGNVAHLKYDDQWALGGRAGVLLTNDTLLYALAAYTELNTSDLEILGGAEKLTVPKFTGYALGGGMQTRITEHILLGMEYRYNKYDVGQIDVPYTPINLTMEPVVQTVHATLTYEFNFFGAPPSTVPLK
jgi:outer membrane immunogenic protein